MASNSPEKRLPEPDRLCPPDPEVERRLEQLIKEMCHELSKPLTALSNLRYLIEPYVEQDVSATYGRNVEYFESMLEYLRKGKLTLFSASDFRNELERTLQDIIRHEKKFAALHLAIDPLPGNCAEMELLTSKEGWRVIGGNLIQNAHRKNAQNIHVSFSCTTLEGSNALVIEVEDDGEGIEAGRLANINEGYGGMRVSDKTIEESVREGKHPELRGTGLQIIRGIIKRNGGLMRVESVLRKDHPARPYTTTFIFTLPIRPDESAIPPAPAQPRMSRRAMLVSTAAGVSALGGVGYAVSRLLKENKGREMAMEPESGKEPAVLPKTPESLSVSDVTVDAEGRIASFNLLMDGKPLTYDRDKDSTVLKKVQKIDVEGVSIVSFHLPRGEKSQSQRMFLSHTEKGLSGMIDLSAGKKNRFAYILSPRKPHDARMRIDPEHIHPLKDDLFNTRGQHAATSWSLLRSADISPVEETVAALSREWERRREADRRHRMDPAEQGIFKAMKMLADVHEKVHRKREVDVTTPEEWERIRMEENQFIVLRESIVRYLRDHPCTIEDAQNLRLKGNKVCFVDTPAEEARSIIPELPLH